MLITFLITVCLLALFWDGIVSFCKEIDDEATSSHVSYRWDDDYEP